METKAEPRNEKGQTLAEFLAAYDENKYRRPSVTVDMVVFTLNERGELCVMPRLPRHAKAQLRTGRHAA